MIQIHSEGAYYLNGQWLDKSTGHARHLSPPPVAGAKSIARRILAAHSQHGAAADDSLLHIRFDALTSHDITYVGIIQTARAGGLREFPVPYVLTNCHNSLCAVGGTINEDDHLFGLSAARKYGGEYVPAHLAVLHQYMREMYAGCGRMILGSDSHTRYGALGCMGVGEGGPELVKQILGRSYDIAMPEVVAVYLEGRPRPGVGPQDVALALIGAVFKQGVVKNKILEFIGPGLAELSVDYRMGIDVMTTESACLSSIWQTDTRVRDWLAVHGREADYKELLPEDGTWYDAVISINLAAIEPMIALPFHPSNVFRIRDFLADADDLLAEIEKEAVRMVGKAPLRPDLRSKLTKDGFQTDQGVVAGCSGGMYENLVQVDAILKNGAAGPGNGAFNLALYPASQPQYMELVRSGAALSLMQAGAVLKSAFCGPCFGAGDVPGHNAFSIRHSTRNFPNREGSKPAEGQISYVALMDARSIAATAANQGRLTPATDLPLVPEELPGGAPRPYSFHREVYDKRVYRGFGKAEADRKLVLGPNITDWPAMPPMPENLLLSVASAIYDPVTTTDELIPSGETSSFRSNPLRLAEFTLSRKDPEYVGRAKKICALEEVRRSMCGIKAPARSAAAPYSATEQELHDFFAACSLAGQEAQTGVGTLVFALKPGDGSAREQAASCQRVLGTWANLAQEYATKRYRSNLVNWGMLPFVLEKAADYGIAPGDIIYLPGIRQLLASGADTAPAILHKDGGTRSLQLLLPDMTEDEREVLLAGCLVNSYAG
ncbi:hydratase [Desulfovibrio sp. OttesenSCG-928-A18]|nr:hydratase [Desulfovibrio sp. OttesenSCG-928-A18]